MITVKGCLLENEEKNENDLKDILRTIDDEEMHVVDKLGFLVGFIRPKNADDIDSCLACINTLIDLFHTEEPIALHISDELNLLFIESKISTNITRLGILSRNGFSYEIKERFYNKFLPSPPKKGDLRYIFTTLFNKKDDHKWVNAIGNEKWIELFSSMFSNPTYLEKTKNHLFYELLYAAEILAIWIASEEFDENFIRLDKTLLDSDSTFIGLQRNISDFIYKIQANNIEIDSTQLDFKHIQVLIEQCHEQVDRLKKKSENHGVSVDLTYELERLGQIVKRLEDIFALIKNFDTPESYLSLVAFFKQSVTKNSSRNSLSEVYQQSLRIVAKSIANNTGEHGEHYITTNAQEYFKMFLSAGGAGIVIAIMALLKITIAQAEFSLIAQTLLTSLNYGLGFVLIHLLGFTVATKQPAMTASSFAQAVEQEEGKRTANQKKLVELVFQVSRSQFAAVLGNVALALSVAFGIAYFAISNNEVLLTSGETHYYLKGLEPFAALFFAAIAGIWLFCSGLIAGYFDNRADLLELKQRYYHHPLLKKIVGDEKREKLASYLHEHHGAMAGNFFFGVLLGVTPFMGYLFGLPLDIRHVAFSSAYLGFGAMHTDMPISEFLMYLGYVLLIGLVNLLVSFMLALKVSLLSRDAYFGNLLLFLKLLFVEMLKRPHQLIFPFGKKQGEKPDQEE